MRVSFKRSFVFIYLIVCASLSLLNYRFSRHYNFQQLDYDLLSENNSQPQRPLPFGFFSANFFTRFLAADFQASFDPQTRINNSTTRIPLFPDDSLRTDRVLEQLSYVPKKLKQTGPVVIRLLPSVPSWGLKHGEVEFHRSACLVQNCILIDKDPANTADAVVFKQAITLTERPNPRQIWIFYTLESPEYTRSYTPFANLINWTASYRWDSDLVAPYERFTLRNQIPKDQRPLQWPQVDPKRNYAKGKTKQVIWFVSHCVTNNRREKYVSELAKHIYVHTYGSCGQYQCPRGQKRCDQLMNRDYKFYLAFENSNCLDYVTEKFFVNGLQHDIIPVVMGAQKDHYKRIAPPNSFIHVDDFKSPLHLAAYLQYLDRNDTAYNEYFKWKGSGQFINTKFWCRLCALLNNPRPKTYQSLEKWWRTDQTCWENKW